MCATAASAGAALVDVGDDPQRRRKKRAAECAQGLSLSLTNRIHTTLRFNLQPPSLQTFHCSLCSPTSCPLIPFAPRSPIALCNLFPQTESRPRRGRGRYVSEEEDSTRRRHCRAILYAFRARSTLSSFFTIIWLIPAPKDNARPEMGVNQRRDSTIFGLKTFNNWIKSVLIHKFAYEPLQNSNTVLPSKRGASQGRVLDIGCGKGGDLLKWAKARIGDYVGVGEGILSPGSSLDF